MRITLHNEEINQALTAYISSAGINLDGKDVEINIIAGRGTNGYSAELDVSPASMRKTVSAVPKSKTKAKPIEDTPVVESKIKPVAVKDKLEDNSKVEEEVTEKVPVTSSKSLFA